MARKTKKQREAESGQGVYRYETYSSEFWDWGSYRIPDHPILISPNGWTDKDGKLHPSRKLAETMGHKCPRCPGTLAWGNGGPFIWSIYMLWCPDCNGAWHASHKYIWGLVLEIMAQQGIQVEDTREEEEEPEDDSVDDSDSQEPVPSDIPQPSEPKKKRRKRRSKESD